MWLGPGPHLLREAAVDLEGEEVHLEVLLLEHRVQEVEEEAHLRHQRRHVLHPLHSRVQLLRALEVVTFREGFGKPDTPSFFYKGSPIRDGNMGLVGMPVILRDVD